MKPKTLAIVPARGGSKRVPGKNIRPFLGKPLILWSLEFARQAELFDRIVVSTDSPAIAACCREAGFEVDGLRPALLASDTANSVDVALHALDAATQPGTSYEFVALLQPTSPFRRRNRWVEAFTRVSQVECDAVIGVSPVRDHPWHVFKMMDNSMLTPWHDSQQQGVRTQDLPPAVVINGSLYLIRTSALRRARSFLPPATFGVACDSPIERIDIDTEEDWIAAEALISYFQES